MFKEAKSANFWRRGGLGRSP